MKSILRDLLSGTSLPLWAAEGAAEGAEPEQKVEAEAKVTPEAKTEEAKAEPEGKVEPEAKVEAKPEAKSPDWRDNEIGRLRAQLERERAKAPADFAEKPKPAANATNSDPDFEARVDARAEQKAQAKAFNDACAAAAQAGRGVYGEDFGARLTEITSKLVNINDPVSATKYNLFLKDTIEAADGDPQVVAKIIYELGGDLNEADRVMNLSSVKRGAELAKLSAREAKDLSKAPNPITPVSARGDKHETIKASDPTRADNLSTASWMERRNAEVAAKEAAQGYRR